MPDQSLREYLENRKGALKTERTSFDSHYKELTEWNLPRKGRYVVTDRNKGNKRHNKILDNTGLRAANNLSAGMVGGITSPARPWFRLTTPDPDLAKFAPVRIWLSDVEKLLFEIFARSNTYNVLPSMYKELGNFGTGVSGVFDNFGSVIRLYPFTVGSYWLAADDELKIRTMYREVSLSVGQLVQRFGKKNVSNAVRQLYSKGQYDEWIPVSHAIEPNNNRDLGKRDNLNMPYRSVYWEHGSDKDETLGISGYQEFPIIAPRWEITGTDIYGTDCPGMIALGDIKGLQDMHKQKAIGVQKMVNPPMTAPGALRDSAVTTLPGGVTYVDQGASGQGFQAAYQVNLRINELREDIFETQQRIKQAFYEDLFLLTTQSNRRQITAREIEERHEEKLIMLGPVLERLQDELLDPLIDRVFNMAARVGILPPPPEELSNVELKVEYISILAQAQKAVGVSSVDRLLATTGALAQLKAEALDKLDADQVMEEYADMLGTSPRLIVDDDTVAAVREQRAQQQRMAQQAALAESGSQTAKNLADSDMSGDNALTGALAASQGATGGGPTGQ